MMLTVFDSDDKIFKAICLGADAYMLKTDLIEYLPHEVMRRSLNIIFSDGSYLTPSIAKKILILFRDLTIPDKIQNTIERFKKLFTQSNKLDMDNMEYKLSPTQIAILEDIVNGMKSSEIAQRREISENTVGTHIKAIYKKLEVNSRAKAVKKAIEERIINQKK